MVLHGFGVALEEVGPVVLDLVRAIAFKVLNGKVLDVEAQVLRKLYQVTISDDVKSPGRREKVVKLASRLPRAVKNNYSAA